MRIKENSYNPCDLIPKIRKGQSIQIIWCKSHSTTDRNNGLKVHFQKRNTDTITNNAELY